MLYTSGLPADLRAARRDEVDDDLWCQQEEAAALGRSARSLESGPAPATPVRDARRHQLAPGLPPAQAAIGLGEELDEETPDRSARWLIVAALTYAILLFFFIPFSHSVWTGSAGVYAMIGTIVGVFAFSATALGLAWRFQDHLGPIGSLGAMVTTLGAVMSMFGSIVPLLVGSAMLMLDLARIGVFSWAIPVVQVVSVIAAVVFTVAQPNLDDAGTRALDGRAARPIPRDVDRDWRAVVPRVAGGGARVGRLVRVDTSTEGLQRSLMASERTRSARTGWPHWDGIASPDGQIRKLPTSRAPPTTTAQNTTTTGARRISGPSPRMTGTTASRSIQEQPSRCRWRPGVRGRSSRDEAEERQTHNSWGGRRSRRPAHVARMGRLSFSLRTPVGRDRLAA